MTLSAKNWMTVVPLALGLAACSPSGPDSEENSPAEATADAPATTESATEDTMDSATESPAVATTIEVTAEGSGPIGLKSATEADVESRSVSGTLITGPGGCFSLTDDDRPQLLVFSDDASFVLRDGRPSVTTDDLGTVNVGEEFSASATTVGLDETTGIPERCAQGAADDVLVVTGA